MDRIEVPAFDPLARQGDAVGCRLLERSTDRGFLQPKLDADDALRLLLFDDFFRGF